MNFETNSRFSEASTKPFPTALMLAVGIFIATVLWFSAGYMAANHSSFTHTSNTINLTIGW